MVLIWLKRNRKKLLILTVLFSLSIIFSSGFIENPDTQLRLSQTRFLVENNSITIVDGVGEPTHGNIAYNSNGDAYSVYNPGQTILFIPLYLFAHKFNILGLNTYYSSAFLASFVSYIIYGFIILIFFKIGIYLNISNKRTFITTIIFAFTSYCFANAQDSYEQIYEAVFILFVWLLLLKMKNYNSIKNIIIISLMIGFGIIFRNTIILAIPGIIILLNNNKGRFIFLLGLTPFIVIILSFNYLRFDNPFDTGYSSAWNLAFEVERDNGFSLSLLPKHIFGLLFSFGKGLIIFSPTIILAFYGIIKGYKHHRKYIISILITGTLYVLLYGANFAWHGSAWSWGPRYIIPIVPLMYIGLFFIDFRKNKLIISTLIIVSFFIQLSAVSVFYKRHLIKELDAYGDIFWKDEYFFMPKHSPIKGQFIALSEIIEKGTDHDYQMYLPQGPWKNEARPASQEMMLDSSIDLNSINFWWFRTLYFKGVNSTTKIIIILFIGITILWSIFIVSFNYYNINEK